MIPPSRAGLSDGRLPDPRGIRVSLVAGGPLELEPIVLEPPAVPVAPTARVAGSGLLGRVVPAPAAPPEPRSSETDPVPGRDDPPSHVLVDGTPVEVRLVPLDDEHAILVREGSEPARLPVVVLPAADPAARPPASPRGVVRREVVVGGWRVEVEVEPATRAALRERARRGREDVGHSGPTEVRAIIPGVVVSVSVSPGDDVTAGQQLLVVEAMKMQNELRAPRDGRIERVAVAAGRKIEVGDLLLVIA